MSTRHLVVGATGVAGAGIVRHLAAATADPVFALSRRGGVEPDLAGRVEGVCADLLAPDSVAAAVAATAPTHVYYAAHRLPARGGDDVHPRWMQAAIGFARPLSRVLGALHAGEGWLCGAVNARSGLVDGGESAAMIAHLLAALAGAPVRHVALVTGGRLHGVHLGPDLWAGYPAVITEDSPRHPGPSWYFGVEDALVAAGRGASWSWSIHRPHCIVGACAAAPYSLVNALGGYAALCREAGRPLVFLGGERVFRARFEAADAELIGAQMRWAADTPKAHGEAFLVTNGGPWWWPEIWPALAARFGLDWDVPAHAMALGDVVPDAEAVWARARAGLPPMALAAAVPVPFLHMAMVMTWDVSYSLDKGRAAGFTETRDHRAALFGGLDRLEAAGILPPGA